MSTVELLNQLVENLEGSIKPTEIYNEGWMLKCVMEQIKGGEIELEKCKIPKDEMWLSETLVPTFFKAINRKDTFAETATRADAIVGQLQIRKGTKWGIEIQQNCSCLYIVEAKMYSKLSKKVTRASDFNQCARNVACLMKMIYEGIKKNKITEIPPKIGFYVFIPEKQKNVFKNEMTKENIKQVIKKRLNSYFDDHMIKENYKEKKEEEFNWLKENLNNFIEILDIEMIFWEDLIKATKNSDTKSQLIEFYENCQNPYSIKN